MTAEPGLAHMRRAIQLAQARVGLTGDNPAVGCVIVRGEAIIGEAATAVGGRPHAEEQALEQAGPMAAGATAYITLEPCGERSNGSASCSTRLVQSGVARVVVACEDPSTFAAGCGSDRLRDAGIPVQQGFLAEEAACLYADYKPAR